jgi:hypothetical protein
MRRSMARFNPSQALQDSRGAVDRYWPGRLFSAFREGQIGIPPKGPTPVRVSRLVIKKQALAA